METIAESGGCRVDRCTHGTIYFSIGALTVRLERTQFQNVAELACEALARLRGSAGDDLEAC
jgi:hypothetical protein